MEINEKTIEFAKHYIEILLIEATREKMSVENVMENLCDVPRAIFGLKGYAGLAIFRMIGGSVHFYTIDTEFDCGENKFIVRIGNERYSIHAGPGLLEYEKEN